MTRVKITELTLVAVLTVSALYGQTSDSRNDPSNPPPPWVQKVEDSRQKQARRLERMERITRPVLGVATGKELDKAEAAEKEKKQIIAEINQKLDAPEHRKRYAEFLKSKHTGLARLYPEKNCGKGKIVTVEELERCAGLPEIPGAGSLFSVRLNALPEYVSLRGVLHFFELSDIHFVDDKFVVGNERTQDIISNIGDVDLQTLDLKSPGFQFLKSFKPAKTKTQLEEQQKMLEKGVSENGFLYSSSAPVRTGDTYVLRSIAFNDGYPWFWFTDLLIAIKVVGQESDGSIVILWKQLKEKDAPFLSSK